MKPMATLNQCSFIGRLGNEPELKVTGEKGTPFTKFSLAVDQGKGEDPLWLNIVCWDKLAEQMEKLLYKGAQVYVQGRLKITSYKDKQQVKRQTVEIVATIVQLLDKAKAADEPAHE
jgi:single-strand DNA-binding protein